jgi:hypothetical protein
MKRSNVTSIKAFDSWASSTTSMSSASVQTSSMSSASIQTLSLTDSHSEFTGRSHGNIDDFDGTLRSQYHDKENMYHKSTEHSDIGRHFNPQDDSRINALKQQNCRVCFQ